jgi:hypothetical protein
MQLHVFAILLNTHATGNDNLQRQINFLFHLLVPRARCNNKQTFSQLREHNKVGRSLRAIQFKFLLSPARSMQGCSE